MKDADYGPLPLPGEEQQVRRTFLRLRGTVDALLAAADAGRSAATGAFEMAERDAARRSHREVEKAAADASEAYERARQVLRDRANRIAPFAASARWEDPGWRSYDWVGSTSARHIRIGALNVPGAAADTGRLPGDPVQGPGSADLPAIVPFLDSKNLAFAAEGEDRTWPIAAIHGALLRALATVPAGRLEIVTYDPRIRGVTSPFSALRRAGNDLLGDPLATPSELVTTLTLLRAAVTRVAEIAGGLDAVDLADVTRITGVQTEPYRLLVVCDYPYGIDPAAHKELVRLAEGGPHRGVSLLIHYDGLVKPDHGVEPEELLKHAVVVRGLNAGVEVSELPVMVRPDPPPPRALIEGVSAFVAEGARRGAAPVVEFAGLLPDADGVWAGDATQGMTARIGRAGLEVIELELRGSDPSLPNVLIGGASGQGKSNLLLVLLHSIAASYPPKDVAMYLLDYKDGLEFDRLGPRPRRPWSLPHARVLGLEGDRPFGLAVLRHLDEEFRRRAERFRLAGVNDLASFRLAHPEEVMPRLLLAIDEFQVLIADDDDIARSSIMILETLARRGRAVGVHLVLASQTLSGIETLSSKERSIFGQFPWRISLKTEASESAAILGQGNTEAAQLRFRGEIVLNREYGDPEHNRRGVVAYADDNLLDGLRRELWELAGKPEPPQVFYAARPSDPTGLPSALGRVLKEAPAGDDTRYALLGLPVDVDPHPLAFGLTADPGRTLAVIGDGRDDAFGVLGSAAWSLARQQLPGGAEFVLLDAIGGAAGSPEAGPMAQAIRAQGHRVNVHAGSQVVGALAGLAERIEARMAHRSAESGHLADDDANGELTRPIYVLGLGLHRTPRLDHIDDLGQTPADALQTIVREGPLVDVHLLGWWNSLWVFSEHLRHENAAFVGGYVFLRTPEGDVQAVLGANVRYTPQPHRGLYADLSHGGSPQPFVPFSAPR
jgi:S-DNA-T family DNA segregation ATPase FtsK/SpoIIIE